jgi:hypothetical protein
MRAAQRTGCEFVSHGCKDRSNLYVQLLNALTTVFRHGQGQVPEITPCGCWHLVDTLD